MHHDHIKMAIEGCMRMPWLPSTNHCGSSAAAASQRDAAGRHASQWVVKLSEALDAAEAKDAEVDELHLQHKTVGCYVFSLSLSLLLVCTRYWD